MLEIQDLENLFDVLNLTQSTFENAYTQFIKFYENDTFKYCFVLYRLLQNKVIVGGQKYIAIYIIDQCYANKSMNPLIANILEMCEMTNDEIERKLIYELFVQKKDYHSQLISELNQIESFYIPEDFKQFKLSILSQQCKLQNFRQLDANSVVIDYQQDQSLPFEKVTQEDISNQGFPLDFLRPIPNQIELNEDPIWLNPSLILDYCWDYKMCNDNNMNIIVKELIQKAHSVQLNPQEIKILNDTFEKDSKIVYNCGVSPQTFHDLVEKNPSIASTILIKLVASPQISSYFEKLVNMELSLSSLELINRVANAVELPKEFLTLYITNCILYCEENKKDKNLQNRYVRLVCVFIKSMIKNKIINPKDMFLDLQAFCIEFSKISEASALFKMLKLLDQGRNDQN